MKALKLSRRALLRGAGVAIALPVLDAMLDSRGLFHGTADAQARTSPLRLFTFFFPNGADMANWVPASAGPLALTPLLAPLMPHRDYITQVSRVNLRVTTGQGDNHGKGTCCFATAAPLTAVACTGPSVDQVAQEELGMGRRTLVLGVQNKPCCFTAGGVTNVGDIYGEVSWSRTGVVESVREPSRAFDSLFGMGPVTNAAAERARRYEQSVLTYVRESTTRLSTQLGAADRQRLDAHLTAIRELETRVAATVTTCMAPGRPPDNTPMEDAGYSTAKARMQLDLMALAMACDISRFGSFMLGSGSNSNGCAGRAMTGADLAEHESAHMGDTSVGRYDQIRIYKGYQLQQIAYLLEKLRTYTEPGGNVLDNSLIYIGSELSDPVAHSNDNLPILLAGHAGGSVPGGRHVAAGGAPLGNLLLTCLRAVGSRAASIGNSTGTIPGILA